MHGRIRKKLTGEGGVRDEAKGTERRREPQDNNYKQLKYKVKSQPQLNGLCKHQTHTPPSPPPPLLLRSSPLNPLFPPLISSFLFPSPLLSYIMGLALIQCSLDWAVDTMRPGEWRQIEGMHLNKPNYDMMTALTMPKREPQMDSRAFVSQVHP
ncbi:unnamed protein product [Pleuronectes platessa]|uniref:Uncharacterized protein n=1 Tax=Pleuronectes platessa TaxID=8262 RepID=A0A9N7YFP2_PLEPL|nr:unnamed protein product [Pleuronectes platessa]